MIRVIPLSESKNYNWHIYDKKFQKAIKVDVCIMVDKLETYYSIKDETIYIDDLHYIHYGNRIEDHETLNKTMFNELIQYLEWENWNIGISYYGFEQGMIRIKHIKEKTTPKNNKIKSLNLTKEINNIIHDVLPNPNKIRVKHIK